MAQPALPVAIGIAALLWTEDSGRHFFGARRRQVFLTLRTIKAPADVVAAELVDHLVRKVRLTSTRSPDPQLSQVRLTTLTFPPRGPR